MTDDFKLLEGPSLNNPFQELYCLNIGKKIFGVLVISGKLSQSLSFPETCWCEQLSLDSHPM